MSPYRIAPPRPVAEVPAWLVDMRRLVWASRVAVRALHVLTFAGVALLVSTLLAQP